MTEAITDYQNLVPYYWYCIDPSGNIGEFCNAGSGELPDNIKADKARYESWMDSVGDYFEKELPERGGFIEHFKPQPTRRARQRKTVPLGQIAAAQGLFVYDYDLGEYMRGTSSAEKTADIMYWKIYSPENPLNIEGVPEQIQIQMRPYRIGRSFSETDCLSEIEIMNFFS